VALCKYPVYQESVGGIRGCGTCSMCLSNRRSQKAGRLALENRQHEHVLFVTLTYKNEFLPLEIERDGQKFSHPTGVLDYETVKKFLKKVRRRFPAGQVRFFCAGEYGDKNGRPHYHFVFWGIPFEKRGVFFDCWSDPNTLEGFCDPDRLDVQIPRSGHDVVTYVSKYVTKNMTAAERHKDNLEGRPPEFTTSSKSIALEGVKAIISALRASSGRASIDMKGDIPRSFDLDGKSYPIDRYMRQKILEALGEKEEISDFCQNNYSEEMRALLRRAASNPEIPKTWLDPWDVMRNRWAMEKQLVTEKRGSLEAAESRAQLFDKGTKL